MANTRVIIGRIEQVILYIAFLFKGISLNYESFTLPETSSIKWTGINNTFIIRSSGLRT